jgi:FkbM family methyltransferase
MLAPPVSAAVNEPQFFDIPAPHGLRAEGVLLETVLGPMVYPRHCNATTPTLAEKGQWEPELTALVPELLWTGATFLDIGAHVGWFTRLASLAVGSQGRVYAFEPAPCNYALLSSNVSLAATANVTCFNVAVGEREGTTSFAATTENSGDGRACATTDTLDRMASRYQSDHQPTITVPYVTLDRLLAGLKVDLIKMDIQGLEQRAFAGMAELVERCRPTLVVEFDPWNIGDHGDDPIEVIDLYRSAGYEMRVLEAPGIATDAPAAQIVQHCHEQLAEATLLLTPR